MSGIKYKYVTETNENGVTLTLPQEIYEKLSNENFGLEYRPNCNSQLKKSVNGKRQYFGTLKSYVENYLNIKIQDFADGNRLNFKRSNLILKK